MNTKVSVKSFPSSLLKDRGEYRLLITYCEIKKYIIDNIDKKIINTNKEVYNNDVIEKYINNLLRNKIYNNLSTNTTINTLNYLFFHLRNSIYVEIRNNKVKTFQPFANALYKNNWSHNITFEYGDNIHEYIKHKSKYFRIYQKYETNKIMWWSNNVIINNEKREDIWGTHSLSIYKEILDETCKNYKINDVDLFINKRDHPLLKLDLTEPYDKLFPDIQKLPSIYLYQSYTPILSPYVDDDYADIPFIIPDDWELTKKDYKYTIDNDIKWEDKVPTAIFRGSATGFPDLENNQRLQIAKLSIEWNNRDNLLDAGIVSYNSKDKVNLERQMTFIKTDIPLVDKIPMNDQIKYKYIISIAGHSGGVNRISWILQSGCLWLKVKPLKTITANKSWYSNLLKKDIHYIEINEDLSNLEEKIIWCRNNDEKCKEIVKNANDVYNTYFTKDSLLKYSSFILNSISNNFN